MKRRARIPEPGQGITCPAPGDARRRPRILVVNYGWFRGGAETQLTLLLRHLARDCDLLVASCANPVVEVWRGLCESLDIYRGPTLRLPAVLSRLRFLAWLPLDVARLARIARRRNADLVLVNSSVAFAGALAARWLRIPCVVVVRELVDPAWLRSAIFRILARADRIVAVSDFVREDFRRRTGREGVERVYGGIDVGEWPFHHPRDRVENVGIIGPVVPEKGQLELVRAVGRVAEEGGASLGVRIVGAAPAHAKKYRSQVESACRTLGVRATLVGETARMTEVYRELDVVVVASRTEGQSMVIPEAWASGCAVIASRCGGPAEMITDGVDGLLYEPGDVDGLAAALKRASSDRQFRCCLVDKGHQTVKDRFSHESTGDALAGIIDAALGRSLGSVRDRPERGSVGP